MPKPLPKTLKNGTTIYRVRYRIDGVSTSQTFEDKTIADWFCTQLETHGARTAEYLLDSYSSQLADTNRDDSPPLNMVFDEFIEWKRHQISEATLHGYERDYSRHVKPHLGSRTIASISPDDISHWVQLAVEGQIVRSARVKDRRKAAPLSPKKIQDIHGVLHQVFDFAALPARRYITTNPCKSSSKLPRRIKPAPKGMTPMQWQALHAAMLQLGHEDAADLASFLIGTGWRIGEAMALKVSNVEDYGDGAPMWVTMNAVSRRANGKTLIVDAEGKTQHAIRRIQVDPDTAGIIRRNMAGKKHDDLVFKWKGTQPWATHNFRDRLDKATALAGLPHLTPHAFRHTHVAWMAMANAPLPELQRRIGHASIGTTINVYGSMIGDVSTDAIGAFTKMRDSAPAIKPASKTAAAIEGQVVG